MLYMWLMFILKMWQAYICWYCQEVTSHFVAVLGIERIEQVIPAVCKYTVMSNIEEVDPRIWTYTWQANRWPRRHC